MSEINPGKDLDEFSERLAASASKDNFDLSSLDNEISAVFDERDLVHAHKRNKALRQRDEVKRFFARVSTIESLQDEEIRDWFGFLERSIREPIPLFEDHIEGGSEDYQLYPSCSFLPLDNNVKYPDLFFHHLSSIDNVDLQVPRLLMSLGRLCVNARNDDGFNEPCLTNLSRLTRWTGYEVFMGDDLALWIVFDWRLPDSDGEPWFPVSCGLTRGFDSHFSIARLLNSISKLEHATFQEAVMSVTQTRRADKIQIDLAETSDVDRYFAQPSDNRFNTQPSTSQTNSQLSNLTTIRPETETKISRKRPLEKEEIAISIDTDQSPRKKGRYSEANISSGPVAHEAAAYLARAGLEHGIINQELVDKTYTQSERLGTKANSEAATKLDPLSRPFKYSTERPLEVEYTTDAANLVTGAA